ncbi:MAG: hypothetical protein KAU06_06120, partial [Candidatus Marinimicrobia bacterium]|nr:hypothetical protein [Candidatus Neomarinimicrobiota bacterium]
YNTKTATRYPRLLGYLLNHQQDIAFSEVARRASSTVAKLETQFKLPSRGYRIIVLILRIVRPGAPARPVRRGAPE